MPKLTINGKEIEVPNGTTIIQAAKKAEVEIPHFCYHPGLSIAGNCRMCLVEIQGAPKLQIACYTPVAENMAVLTETPKVLKARQGVMEFLLLNHPIDCPVCDCAGECYLQDYYMEHDLKDSRLGEGKNKKKKAVDIGEHVMLDTERCVLCSRCVRFTDEVSKSHELGIFGRGSTEEIGLVPGARLDNPYSGNVIDICPVGALTDKQFRFKSRPWYLEETETVCNGCAQGCNIILNTNPNPYNKVGQNRAYRIYPRENQEVNKFWICDEGRYSYSAIDKERQKHAFKGGQAVPVEAALQQAAESLKHILHSESPSKVAILLSPQLTNEELWGWAWLGKKLGVQQIEFGDEIKKMGFEDNYLIKADKNPNSRGARELGLAAREGVLGAKSLLAAIIEGKYSALICVENDLGGLLGEGELGRLLSKLSLLLTVNAHVSATTRLAHVALPRAVYAEQDGSFVNHAGRVQRVRKAMGLLEQSQPAWAWAFQLGRALGHESPAASSSAIFEKIGSELAGFQGLSFSSLGSHGLALKAAAQV